MATHFDFSELDKLFVDLGEAPTKMIPLVRKAVEVTARNIKDEWRKDAKRAGGRYFPRYADSIDYELGLNKDGEITAEIGPNMSDHGVLTRSVGRPSVKGGIAAAWGIIETGGITGQPATNSGRKALNNNKQDFVKGIGLAGSQALK